MSGKPDRAAPEVVAEEATAGQAGEAAAESPPADATAATGSQALELKARADEYWDKYLRAAAELENVRKRAARDVDSARKFALERFATELLAVRDSFEMGLAAGEQADAASLLEGSRATLKQLAATMERFGISEIDPLGEPFDPKMHEAMTMEASTEVAPGTVLTVYQKGYVLNDRLLRPARVVVASAPGGGQAP